MSDDPPRVAFVCVRNAGRSQMAAAFAERERDRRGLDVEILSGGTRPADEVHGVVAEAMAEAGFDLSDWGPTAVSDTELRACDRVATMGCSTLELEDVNVHDWALTDPGGEDIETVREIREEVKSRVVDLFDDLE